MSPNLATVLAAAESLPVTERRELIALLLEGLDDSPLPAGATVKAWRRCSPKKEPRRTTNRGSSVQANGGRRAQVAFRLDNG